MDEMNDLVIDNDDTWVWRQSGALGNPKPVPRAHIKSDMNTVIIPNPTHQQQLYSLGAYGKPAHSRGDIIPLNATEYVLCSEAALYLCKHISIGVFIGKRYVPFHELNGILQRPNLSSRLAVYSHWRSCHWVVREGMKFAADFMLYHSHGPGAFHAASCLNLVERQSASGALTWRHLHARIRLHSYVAKNLILCFTGDNIIPTYHVISRWKPQLDRN